MREINTVTLAETENEVGGTLGCLLGCGTVCVLTYMAGAAMGVVLADL